jgi:LPS-assembly lipoprotein
MSALARQLAAAAALLGALALSACGFTPLYATPGVTPGLATIQVVAPHGRTAFLLGEALEDEFGTNKAAAPAYKLTITVYERIFPRGLNPNGVAERYEMHVRIDYKLFAVGAPDKVLTQGLDPVEVTYAETGQPYAGMSAQQDAQQRAASTAAQHIRVDLAEYFASHQKP